MNLPLPSVDAQTVVDASLPVHDPMLVPAARRDAANDGGWRGLAATLRGTLAQVRQWIRSLGPYVAIELLLPGGTIIALALWAFRQRKAGHRDTSPASREAAAQEPTRSLHCIAHCGQR